MLDGTVTPVTPDGEATLARWRKCLVAYRAVRRAGGSHDAAELAAEAVARLDNPEMTRREARDDIVNAVGWVTRHHHAWFVRGVPRLPWIWPPTAEGVGLYRRRRS